MAIRWTGLLVTQTIREPMQLLPANAALAPYCALVCLV